MIRLINFYFLNMFQYMTSVVYCRTFLHFMSSLLHNLKTYPPQSRSFEHRICAQTQDLQIYKTCNMSQMNPKDFQQHCIHSLTTLHSRPLPLSSTVSVFNMLIEHLQYWLNFIFKDFIKCFLFV